MIGRSPSGRAGRPTAQAPAGLGDTATIPNAVFTPGPWKFEPHSLYGYKGTEAMPFGYISEMGLASPIFGLEDVLGRPPEELEADALLIASAPELYADLAVLIQAFGQSSEHGLWKRAKATLAKARGEQA